MIVLCVMLIILSMSVMLLNTGLQDSHVRQGYDTSLSQMRMARERAIGERKQYILCFGVAVPPGAATPLGAPTAQSIQLFRWDANTALAAAVQVSNLSLPADVQFQTLVGIPTAPGKVPDGFGLGAVPIDFDQGVAGGNKQQVMFLPDGSARDVNQNLNSGVIYLAKNNDLYSSHAITLFGASGQSRGWTLTNSGGTAAWYEQ
jgi:hypothetical protein